MRSDPFSRRVAQIRMVGMDLHVPHSSPDLLSPRTSATVRNSIQAQHTHVSKQIFADLGGISAHPPRTRSKVKKLVLDRLLHYWQLSDLCRSFAFDRLLGLVQPPDLCKICLESLIY